MEEKHLKLIVMTKDEIKSLISDAIVENTNGEITADKLRSVLLEMVEVHDIRN